jgi:Tol biopolymer transport system component
MGDVFRARDTRLDRIVAVKIAKEHFSERFEREARAIGALNEPTICTLHDVGPNYLVMEFIEGETLAARIARGPIPLDQALAIARQISAALEAAHEKHIVHRDLKPGNIMLRPDGAVKVLDFGLARIAMADATADLDSSPTRSLRTPQSGVIVGTAAYMSPEQTRGRGVDKRVDIWAFGVVFYEMLTGTRPFGGDDLTDVLASVVRDHADLAKTPPQTRRLLAACLEKDAGRRLRDIGDVWHLLDDDATQRATANDARGARVWWWRAAAAVFATGLAVAVAVLFAFRPQPEPPRVTRFQISAPRGTLLPIGTPAPSPDGRTLAYTVTEADGAVRIHLRRLNQVESRTVPGTDGAIHPFWSPDGRSLAFTVSGRRELKRVEVDGGSPRLLFGSVTGVWHGDWSSTGAILVSTAGRLSQVAPSGADGSRVEMENGGHPSFLPDGRRYLFKTNESDQIRLATLGSKDSRLVVAGVESAPLVAVAPTGQAYLLYLQGPDLAVSPFDLNTGSVSGNPSVLVAKVARVASPAIKPAVGVSPSGVLAYQTGGVTYLQSHWLSRSGTPVNAVTPGEPRGAPGVTGVDATVGAVVISPTGSHVAWLGGAGIWVTDLTRGSSTRLTLAPNLRRDRFAWSADGRRLAYGTPQGVHAVDLETGADETLSNHGAAPLSWSSDGHLLVGALGQTLSVIPPTGDRTPIRVGSRTGNTRTGRISPDGRWIAFQSDESGRDEIYVQAMPPGTRRWTVSINGGTNPQWRRDGKELFFQTATGSVMVVDIVSSPAFDARIPRELFRLPTGSRGFEAFPDGQRFLVESPAGSGGDNPITIVLNWWLDLQTPR